MENHTKNILISLYKVFVYTCLYVIFLYAFEKINYALLSLTRTSIITTSAFILTVILMNNVYGNFRIGYKKSKPVFLSTMIVVFIANIIAFLAMAIMGVNQFPFEKIVLPGLLALIVTFILQGIVIWILAHLGNSLYFYLFRPAKTIIIDNNAKLFKKIHKYVLSHDKQYDLKKVYHTLNFNEISFNNIEHVFLSNFDPVFEKEIVEYCYYNDIKLTYSANTYNILIAKKEAIVIDDALMIEVYPLKMTLTQLFIKRLIDIIGSLIILLISSPVFIFVAIAIKLDDGGPIFYNQDRLTKNNKIFKITKFRSMKLNSGDSPVTKDDKRVTNIGKYLRKYRIDELPQMINILKGSMSLVGPRPESVAHSKTIEKTVPEFNHRLKVKAGLTGYAQIFGKYNTTPKMKLRLDIKYIESFSILDDIKLLLQTLFVFFKSDDSTEGFDTNEEKTE